MDRCCQGPECTKRPCSGLGWPLKPQTRIHHAQPHKIPTCAFCPWIQELCFSWCLGLWSLPGRSACLQFCLWSHLLEGPQPHIVGISSSEQSPPLAHPHPCLQPYLLLFFTALPGWTLDLVHCHAWDCWWTLSPAPSSGLCSGPVGLPSNSEGTVGAGVTLGSQLVPPREATRSCSRRDAGPLHF